MDFYRNISHHNFGTTEDDLMLMLECLANKNAAVYVKSCHTFFALSLLRNAESQPLKNIRKGCGMTSHTT